MKKLTYLILPVLTAFFGACSEDVGDYTVRGEALGSFDAQTPANSYAVTINKGTPEATLDFQWTASESGLQSAVTYKVEFDQTEGDFSAPIYTAVANDEGKATMISLPYSQLLEIAGKITPQEGVYNLSWRVEASNASGVKKYTLPFSLKCKVPETGISGLALTAPDNNCAITLNKITAPQEKLTFKWKKATASDGIALTYRLVADEAGKNFENPILSTAPTTDDSVSFTTQELAECFNEAGYTSINMVLQWKVVAIAGTDEFASETRQAAFSIEDIPSLYLVGDATEAGWSPEAGIELKKISDGIFSGIVKLQGGKQWKVVATRDGWDPAWGTDAGHTDPMGGPLNGMGGAPNIPAPAEDGSYKITLNFIDMTYLVENLPSYPTLFMVGDGCSAGWSPDKGLSFGKISDFKFDIYTTLYAGKDIKFLPTNTGWDGDWGMESDKPGRLLQEGEANVKIEEDGYYHVTVDFENLEYKLFKVTSWGIIGDATSGGWNSETPMVFDATTGLWKLDDVTLTSGKIKFRANNDWVLNYGQGNQGNELAENGGDISVDAGTYSLTLDLTVFPYTYQLIAK